MAARTLSVIRSRDIKVMMAVQSLGQLQDRYQNNLWLEILGNADLQLMLGCFDSETASFYSERAGADFYKPVNLDTQSPAEMILPENSEKTTRQANFNFTINLTIFL